jgi:transposase
LATSSTVRSRSLNRMWFALSSVALVWADGGYRGRLLDWARHRLQVIVEIVTKPVDQCGFSVLPWRWVVERTLSWLTAHCWPSTTSDAQDTPK